jgi:hypothetical protein
LRKSMVYGKRLWRFRAYHDVPTIRKKVKLNIFFWNCSGWVDVQKIMLKSLPNFFCVGWGCFWADINLHGNTMWEGCEPLQGIPCAGIFLQAYWNCFQTKYRRQWVCLYNYYFPPNQILANKIGTVLFVVNLNQ